MKILGIDLETSGLNAQSDLILELGMVLYDWDTKVPLQIVTEFVDPNLDIEREGFKVTQEITEITGITNDMLEEYGIAEGDAMQKLCVLAGKADYLMGHNCHNFDGLFVSAACSRTNWAEPAIRWLDTSVDVKYPPRIKTRNLRHLAAEHGFLNPLAHRAVFDVLTMFKVASNYRLEDIIARANEPTVYLQALVSFDEKEQAKERGYRWNPGWRVWWKEFKESDAREEVEQCGFKTAVLSGRPVEV